jgi:hypothetical protein
VIRSSAWGNPVHTDNRKVDVSKDRSKQIGIVNYVEWKCLNLKVRISLEKAILHRKHLESPDLIPMSPMTGKIVGPEPIWVNQDQIPDSVCCQAFDSCATDASDSNHSDLNLGYLREWPAWR